MRYLLTRDNTRAPAKKGPGCIDQMGIDMDELVLNENAHGSTTIVATMVDITVRTHHKPRQSGTHNIRPYTFTTVPAANRPRKTRPIPLYPNHTERNETTPEQVCMPSKTLAHAKEGLQGTAGKEMVSV